MSLIYSKLPVHPYPFSAFTKQISSIYLAGVYIPGFWGTKVETELVSDGFSAFFDYTPKGAYDVEILSSYKPGREAAQNLLRSKRYYSSYNILKSLLGAAWDDDTGNSAPVPGETHTFHQNIFGDVADNFIRPFREDSSYPDDEAHTRFTLLRMGSGVKPPLLSLHSDPLGYSCDSVITETWLDTINTEISLGTYDWSVFNGPVTYCFTAYRITADNLHRIKYTYVTALKRVFSSWLLTFYHFEVSFAADYSTPLPEFIVGETYELADFVIPRVSCWCGTLGTAEFGYFTSVPSRQDIQDEFIDMVMNPDLTLGDTTDQVDFSSKFEITDAAFPRTPFTVRGGFSEFVGLDVDDQFVYGQSCSYLRFHEIYSERISGFVGGCAASSRNALDDYTGGLDNNYIEAIMELKEILKPLDTLRAMQVFLKRNTKKGIMPLLHLLADADLAYKFGVVPTMSVASDISKNLIPYIKRVQSGYYMSPHTARGKVIYTLTDGPFSPVYVTCRTKMRVEPSLDSVIPYITTLDGLGILPRFSRIWDTVPYSWFIDTFFNVGEGLSYIDTSLIRLLYNVAYTTNSISVEYFFSNEEKTEYSFRDVNSAEPSGYRQYLRYVIPNGIQNVLPTTLPLLETQKSSWDIYTSVVIQQI